MPSLKQWLDPSRQLPALFLTIAVLLAGSLLWLGWTLTSQDEEVARQRLQERRESAADIAVAALQTDLSEIQQRLAELAAEPVASIVPAANELAAALPDDSVLLLLRGRELDAYPERRLLFYPVVTSSQGPPESVFLEADRLELRDSDLPGALAALRPLTRSSDPAIRAAALLRTARIERKQDKWEAALATYDEMARLGDVFVEGLPAELVSLQARLAVLEHLDRADEQRLEAAALLDRLNSNSWRLSRGVYEFYLAEAGRVLGFDSQARSDAAALSASVVSLNQSLTAEPDVSGRRLLENNGLTTLALWRSNGDTTVALLLGAKWIESRGDEGLGASSTGQGVAIGLTDPEGNPVLGPSDRDSNLQTVRLASATGLPWNLHAVNSDADEFLSSSKMRRQLIFGVLAVITLLIVAGSVVVGRAVRRELVLSRMQSDFVSAVSHEFRTPLTSVCLLSEQLAAGRVTNEDDRGEFYRVISRESQRLRRLVEGLLNFGRMEAGAIEYNFETIDPAELVREVAREFRNDLNGSTFELDVQANGDVPLVKADRAALSSAIWNLLDNAVKYSPRSKMVQAEVARDGARAAIRVRDRGLGIPADEHRAIFEKFRRGAAARASGVCGTGVGLAMVQRIIAAHGGEIALESEVGEGSVFTLLLPPVN